ncbi:MAG: Ldh family oxidoreductase [Parcubacteria group bacterium]
MHKVSLPIDDEFRGMVSEFLQSAGIINATSAAVATDEVKLYPTSKVAMVCRELLRSCGVRQDIADDVTACLIETSLRGVDSHGVNLLPHYLEVVRGGRINPNPNFKFTQTSPTTALLDADDTFGHAAASFAMKKAIEMSRVSGSGFVSVYNSSHFGACSYYSLQAARENMIGIATTHTSSNMLSTHGSRPFLGTNPISFTFPCDGEDPVCLDMATTQVTGHHVKMAKESNQLMEGGVAVDSQGNITDDPSLVAALLPAGKYKGYGLGLVVEILCSLLPNIPFGRNIVSMSKAPMSQKRKLGHFVGAIDIGKFVAVDTFKKRLKELVTELRNEPSLDPSLPVMVAGDPEKQAYEFRSKNGIPLALQTVGKINDLIVTLGLPKDLLM